MPRLGLDTPLLALVGLGRAKKPADPLPRPALSIPAGPSLPSGVAIPSGPAIPSGLAIPSDALVEISPSGPALPSGASSPSGSSCSSDLCVLSGPVNPSGVLSPASFSKPPGGDAKVAVAIRARARTVKRPMQYIGFFEFVAWCWLRCRNIFLNIGRNWVSLEELYPRLQMRTRGPDKQDPIHLAAAYWDADLQQWGAVHDEYRHAVQHYVIAFPFGKSRSAGRYARLEVQLQQMGYVMILTAAQGDCGIDALAYHDNDFLHATAVEWKRLRHELGTVMEEHAEEPMWQELFQGCAEAAADNPGVRNRKDEELLQEVCNSSDGEVDEDCASEADSFEEYFNASGTETRSPTAGAKPMPLNGPAEVAEPAEPVVPSEATEPSDLRAQPQVRGERASAEPSEMEGQAEGASSFEPVKPSGCTKTLGTSMSAVVPSGSEVPSSSSAPVAISNATVPAERSESSGGMAKTASSTWLGGGYRNPVRLRDHLRTLSEQELRLISGSLEAFQAYEKKFFEMHPPPKRKRADNETELPSQVRAWNATLHQRMAMGRAYQMWLGTPEGQAAVQRGCQRRSFIVAGTARTQTEVTKKETMRLSRAWELVLTQDLLEGRLDKEKQPEQFALAQQFKQRLEKKRTAAGETKGRAEVHFSVGHGVAAGEGGGMFRRVCYGGLPAKYRRRQLRFQGRKFKCPALRQELYDWFVNMRSIFAKIPPGTIKKQAQIIAKKVWRLSREQNIWPELPRITYKWVRGWRREWNVSLRKPNAKFKLSKEKLYLRLGHVWRANLHIRWLAHYCLGRKLIAWGCDQKPIYMNEGGHKNQPTCHFEGAELAVAKDNVAQSRERVSVMTTVTSDMAEALAGRLPVALCFKGKTDRIIQNLPKSLGKHVIFQYAPKGSYRVEHVVEFLQRALPAWTEERAAAQDWRILYLDAYAAHFAQDVVATAFARGFVVLWHGAGTTGLMQVNDTHLHASFERIYLEMEGESFSQQQFWDPTDISRHREDVACDVAATWAALDHKCAAKGHVSNGLTHDLEGDDDARLSRDVREAWLAIDGPTMSLEIRDHICAKVAAGEYRWDWETIQLLSGRDAAERHLGAYATEGRELEAAQQEGQPVFEDKAAEETEEEREEMKQARGKRRKKFESTAESSGAVHVIEGTVVPVRESDTEAAKRVAENFAEKRRVVEEVRAAAKGEEWAPTRWNCDRKLQVLLKSYCPGLRVEQEGEDLVKRYMAAEAAVEAEKRERAREEARKRKAMLARQKAIKQKLQNEAMARKLAKQKEKEKQEAVQAAKALMEREFSLGELTPQKAKGSKAESRQARLDFLERLRMVYGISSSVQASWPEFCEWYVDWIVRPASKAGPQNMIDLKRRLEVSASKAKLEGRVSQAFNTWVKEMKTANMKVLEPATKTKT